jgi:hypothetical protein
VTGPYRRVPAPGPRRRLLAVILGMAVTAAIAAALVWSVTRWPATCARRLDPSSYLPDASAEPPP